MKIDLYFFIAIIVIVIYVFVTHQIEKITNVSRVVENMADVTDAQIDAAVRRYYFSDEFINNISQVAAQLQQTGMTTKGGITVGSNEKPPGWVQLSVNADGDPHLRLKTRNDENKNIYLINRDSHFRLNTHGVGDMFGVNKDGHHYIRHLGDHVAHMEGDGNNPFITFGKTGTWDNQKMYFQNVNAHTKNPTYRLGIHGTGILMDMDRNDGVRWPRKDGRWTNFDASDGTNYIRGNTVIDGNVTINGAFNILPRGTIIAFNSVNPPPGWALCDGQNGTPDLRGRFIRMQSDTMGGFADWGGKTIDGNKTAYQKGLGGNSRADDNSVMLNHRFGDKSGTDHHVLSASEIPPHRHYTAIADPYWNWGDSYLGNGNGGFAGGGGARFGTGGQAFMTGWGNESGLAGWGHNNQPPYYVLSYIMKL